MTLLPFSAPPLPYCPFRAAGGAPGSALCPSLMSAPAALLFRSCCSPAAPHSHLLHLPRSPSRLRNVLRRATVVSAVADDSPQALQVFVKESLTTPGRLGDCPFSQRVLLTLEEKNLPYDLKLVDIRNKPDWFLAVSPEGKVPIIKIEENWLADSDVITQALEERYPDPPLAAPPEKASVGSKIFSSFIRFLQSKDPNDGTEQALVNELTAFNEYLKESGPYINGNIISAADLSLGPKLYHLEIALGHYKNWSFPESLTHVRDYMKSIFSRDSFTKTRALREDVVSGWRPKVYA